MKSQGSSEEGGGKVTVREGEVMTEAEVGMMQLPERGTISKNRLPLAARKGRDMDSLAILILA